MDVLKPAIELLDQHLQSHPVCNEHALIKLLQAHQLDPFQHFNLKQSKSLFSAHFLVKHCLYTLQSQGLEQRAFVLNITSVSVQRQAYHPGTAAIARHDAVRNYYLDINHYFETSEDDVNELLNSFWQRFLLNDDKAQALQTLGLEQRASYRDIQTSYRRLAQRHHPDKGGSTAAFVKIQAAKAILDGLYKP